MDRRDSSACDGESLVRLELRGAGAIVELHRPQSRNALNEAMLDALAGQLAAADATAARAIILTGAGTVFCSGDDLKVAMEADNEGFKSTLVKLQRVTAQLLDLSKPIIAALNGPAFGAGLELVLACDMRLATPAFACATPEARLGLLATNGASVLLPHLIGPSRARRLLYFGERMDAQWCLAAGLVDEVVSQELLLDRALELAQQLCAAGPNAVAATRAMLNAPLRQAVADALALEADACGAAHASPEGREGLASFLSRRPPSWLDGAGA